jgi:hypothetical protein
LLRETLRALNRPKAARTDAAVEVLQERVERNVGRAWPRAAGSTDASDVITIIIVIIAIIVRMSLTNGRGVTRPARGILRTGNHWEIATYYAASERRHGRRRAAPPPQQKVAMGSRMGPQKRACAKARERSQFCASRCVSIGPSV